MDIFGCAHSVTQNVTIDPHCQAAVKVEKYFLCPDCHGSDNVMVTFKNLSTGGKCPLTFKWDFGDGQTATSNESLIYQTHPYLITNCQLGQTFTLKLTMTDNSTPTPCTSYASIPVVIEPCHADFDTIICPNGDVICEGNMWGEFVFPPGANIIDYGPVDAEGLRKKMTVNMGDGMHLITFTGHCSTGGRCLVPKTAIVNSVCCTKNDADRGHTEFWAAGKEYRMKYNMVQRQFFLTHHIKVKTKLKKHKKIVGIWYWKGKKADEIEASFDGDIFMNGNPCKCDIKTTVSQSEINFGKSKAKFYYQVGAEYRSRKESLISTHRVVKDGQSATAHCKLGKDCDD